MKKKNLKVCFSLFGVMCIILLLHNSMTEVKAEEYQDFQYQITNDGTVCITGYNGEVHSEIFIPEEIDGYVVTSINPSSKIDCDKIIIPKSVTQISSRRPDSAYILVVHDEIVVDSENKIYSSLDGILYNKEQTKLISCPVGKKKINIPESVTSIDSWALCMCESLTDVIIPKSVTSIGYRAFWGCKSLTDVTIPESVTSIEMGAFSSCKGLTSVTIPESVTSISGDVFSYCENLTNVTIPKSVTSIGSSAFSHCENLANVTIPESVTSMGNSAFSYCESLTSLTIPEGVTSIGNDVFSYCGLTDVTIPESVTSIGNFAFSNCKSLTNVTIPESVTRIGDAPFRDCENLQSILVDEGNEHYASYEGVLYNKALTELLCCPGGKIEITIPESVTGIGSSAFYGCRNLADVIIPESVTNIGDTAFWGCKSLTNIAIPESVTSIGGTVFGDCESLTGITIPESVTKVGNFNFAGCKSLTSIIIPKCVTSIGISAFSGCESLTDVIIPESVTSISYTAFYGCKSLRNIIIPKSVTNIASTAFKPFGGGGCENLQSILVDAENEYYVSYEGVLYNKTLTELVCCPSAKSEITIPESVTRIGSDAFSGCKSLIGVAIPESVTSIEFHAFWDCESLTEITIPESVTNIGYRPFEQCYALRKITNNSTTVMDLSSINPDIWWYDAITGQHIEELGTGTAIAGAKAEEIDKSDVLLEIGAGFVDKDGNNVEIGNVVIKKETLILPDEAVIRAAENMVKNMSELSKIFYYDLSAYINKIGGEPAILNGYVTIKLNYPSGITKEHNIIVLHNTEPIEDVKKFDDYFTFKTNGFSPFTVIAIEERVPDEEQIRGFVNRLYTLVLGREAEEEGLESWTNALVSNNSNGVDAGYGFVFSDECRQKNLSNADFVEMLYNTFMNRASDEGGKTAWVSQLDAGVEREKIFEGFIYSAEFAEICADYGIYVGSTSDVEALENVLSHYRNQNADITKFVARCYTQGLERDYESDGLEAWCKAIIENSNTPKQVAQNFIFSDEFTQKNLNNEKYVKILYRTFMGREADETGLAAWVEVLESGREDRGKVMEGFSDSVEFDGILQSFGLNE